MEEIFLGKRFHLYTFHAEKNDPTGLRKLDYSGKLTFIKKKMWVMCRDVPIQSQVLDYDSYHFFSPSGHYGHLNSDVGSAPSGVFSTAH